MKLSKKGEKILRSKIQDRILEVIAGSGITYEEVKPLAEKMEAIAVKYVREFMAIEMDEIDAIDHVMAINEQALAAALADKLREDKLKGKVTNTSDQEEEKVQHSVNAVNLEKKESSTIQSAYQERIDRFMNEHINFIKAVTIEQGGFEPMMTLLVKKGEEFQIIPMVIVGGFRTEEDKEALASQIPKILEGVSSSQKVIPICFSFASEIWSRKMEGSSKLPDNWKEFPKTEGILITFETEYSSKVVLLDMERVGTTTNQSGDMIDKIVLTDKEVPSTEAGGRFMNLFRKFNNSSEQNKN